MAVKSVKRSQGRSAVAAAAYRAGCRLECEREGRAHDYGRKRGVEAAFILAPEDAPEWVQDRERLWNAAEAAENRKNSIVAREWELALPYELDPERRRELVGDFARALVERFGVAADVAIHAPHPAGDQRNHHAHVLTTTRSLGAEGLGAKTRALDVASTARGEVTAVRALWCGLQNAALELAERERGLEAGALDRVDPRTLAAQREEALARGDALRAEALDRAPEVKLGPVVSGVERRAAREAEQEGREYEPVTERGAQVHEARTARALFAEMRAGLEAARARALEFGAGIGAGALEAAQEAREAGRGAWSSGWSALRGAAARLWGREEREAERDRGRGLEAPEPAAEERGPVGASAEAEPARSEPLRLGAELRAAEAEPLAVPEPAERAELLARWRELPTSAAREAFVERRAVEWTAASAHPDPEVREGGRRPVIRDVTEAAPRLGAEPAVLLAAVVERSEAVERLAQERLERERQRAEERARERQQERESVERVRRAAEGKRRALESRAERERAQAEAREREAARAEAVEDGARLYEIGLTMADALAGLAPAADVLAPLRAAEAELGRRLGAAEERLGLERGSLADAVADRAEEMRREREAGRGWEPEIEAVVRRETRGAFVEANARAWDGALWVAEREAARTGEATPGPREGEVGRERERIVGRIEHAAIQFGKDQAALREAIEARVVVLDEGLRPERDAEVARLGAERVAEAERLERSVSLEGLAAAVRAGRELSAHEAAVVEAGLEPTLRRVVGDEELARLNLGDHRALAGALPDEGDQLAVARAHLDQRQARTGSGLSARWAGVVGRRLEAWEAGEAARAWEREREEERRREAEREAEAARSREALAGLAEGLRDWGWHQMGAEDKERLRVGLGQHLERAVGPEGVARLDQGDHTALEGVLERAEDRVRLTQVRLLDHGELFRNAELTARGRALYGDLVEAQMAEERALGRGRGRDLDLGDDFGL